MEKKEITIEIVHRIKITEVTYKTPEDKPKKPPTNNNTVIIDIK